MPLRTFHAPQNIPRCLVRCALVRTFHASQNFPHRSERSTLLMFPLLPHMKQAVTL